jgi:hypothetical protein
MRVDLDQNAAVLTLTKGESFYLKPDVLRSTTHFDWCITPPFPLGSPIARIMHGCYFGMRKVKASSEDVSVRVTGTNAVGGFRALDVLAGESFYVKAHNLAGFSSTFDDLHTHVRFAPVFWCLRKHFLPVFSGPGTVLIYSSSPMQESTAREYQPESVIGFNINRPFTAAIPNPSESTSQVVNLFSRAIVWRFQDEGTCLVENRTEEESRNSARHPIVKLLGHLLGLFRV